MRLSRAAAPPSVIVLTKMPSFSNPASAPTPIPVRKNVVPFSRLSLKSLKCFENPPKSKPAPEDREEKAATNGYR